MMVSIAGAGRQRFICELLADGEPLSVAYLSDRLKVSAMTIRRDLDILQSQGKLRRVRGWAEPVRTDDYEPSYIIRARENVREKREIGRAAAALVKDGEVIVIDVGTTLLEFARLLGRTRRVTILTYWLPVVLELAKHPNVRTIVPGGILRHPESSLIGAITGEILGRVQRGPGLSERRRLFDRERPYRLPPGRGRGEAGRRTDRPGGGGGGRPDQDRACRASAYRPVIRC